MRQPPSHTKLDQLRDYALTPRLISEMTGRAL
jgi:hypothetical protein